MKETQCLRQNTLNLCLFVPLDVEMDDFEQEGINEELIEFAIRESIQDAYKQPCSVQTNRYEGVQTVHMSKVPSLKWLWVGLPIKTTSLILIF